MRPPPRSDHLLRYQHLTDRRRLAFELSRLWARITHHPNWPERPASERAALQRELDVPLASARAEPAHVEADVRTLTARLVRLAQALRALDANQALPAQD